MKEAEISSSTYLTSQSPIAENLIHYRNIFASPESFIIRRVDYSKMKVFDEKFRKESERLKSLQKLVTRNKDLLPLMAKTGLYFKENEEEPDKVKCIYCPFIQSGWNKSDIPNKKHRKCFPICPFLLNLDVGNVPILEDLDKESVIDPDWNDMGGPVAYNVCGSFVDESLFDDKLETFDVDWREASFGKCNNLRHLALDGLFAQYKENAYVIKCCMCNKEVAMLKELKIVPHATFHKSSCNYQSKFGSKAFHFDSEKRNFCQVEYSITDEEIGLQLETRKTDELVKIFGSEIKIELIRNLKKTGKNYESIIDFVYDFRNFNNEREDDKINHLELKFLGLCVVCYTNRAGILFLPCGHLQACKICSNLLTNCAVCRSLIVKRVQGIRFVDNLVMKKR